MLDLATGLSMLKGQMLHLSFASCEREMSRTYAGEIVAGAPAVIRNSMACSFDWTVHLHVCVAAGIDADDHHCYTHQPTCA